MGGTHSDDENTNKVVVNPTGMMRRPSVDWLKSVEKVTEETSSNA